VASIVGNQGEAVSLAKGGDENIHIITDAALAFESDMDVHGGLENRIGCLAEAAVFKQLVKR
jgi:hypothetical protein